jgi:hypothetical protein
MDDDDWATRTYGASLRLDLVRPGGRGLFAGVAGGVAQATRTLERTGVRHRGEAWTLAPRLGLGVRC